MTYPAARRTPPRALLAATVTFAVSIAVAPGVLVGCAGKPQPAPLSESQWANLIDGANAAMLRGEESLAIDRLASARRVAERSSRSDLVAETSYRVALSHARLGEADRSLAALDETLAVAEPASAAAVRAGALRVKVLAEAGRPDEAAAALDAAQELAGDATGDWSAELASARSYVSPEDTVVPPRSPDVVSLAISARSASARGEHAAAGRAWADLSAASPDDDRVRAETLLNAARSLVLADDHAAAAVMAFNAARALARMEASMADAEAAFEIAADSGERSRQIYLAERAATELDTLRAKAAG
ncbi:MAG: hypothetical protein AAF108_00365 [Planctomycetota bacterium]